MSGFQKIGGFYLPKSDTHFAALGDRIGRYQIEKLKACMRYVKSFDTAIDAGAHIGIHSVAICKRFKKVHAFEANQENYECLRRNTEGKENVSVHHSALGQHCGNTKIESRETENSGDRQIGFSTDMENYDRVPCVTVDSLHLLSLGFIKIDVQGFEAPVLMGASETIQKFRPVVMFEQEPPGKLREEYAFDYSPADILATYGATKKEQLGADQIWSFD